MILQLLGVGIFFFLKYAIFQVDRPGELIRNLMGIPADVTLIGLMIGLVGIPLIPSDDQIVLGEWIPASILISIGCAAASICLWKYGRTLVDENAAGVVIQRIWLFVAVNVINLIIAVGSLMNPIFLLGLKL